MNKHSYIINIISCCITSVIFSHTVKAVAEIQGAPLHSAMFIQFIAFASMYYSLYRRNHPNHVNDCQFGCDKDMDVKYKQKGADKDASSVN